jgi:hypothetical protein
MKFLDENGRPKWWPFCASLYHGPSRQFFPIVISHDAIIAGELRGTPTSIEKR